MDIEVIKKVIANLFKIHEDNFLEKFVSSVETMEVKTGEFIFQQGDLEYSLYIVLSGRLRAIAKDNEDFKILGDISAGQPVGEFSFFSNEPRSASVVAMRKSHVIKLTEKAYKMLITSYPEIAHSFSKFIYERMSANLSKRKTNTAPKNIAFVVLDKVGRYESFLKSMHKEMESLGFETKLYYPDSISDTKIDAVLNTIDNHLGINLMICDEEHQMWSEHCIANSDAIVILTNFYNSKEVCPIEHKLKFYEKNILNRKKYLLLVHESGDVMPSNTADWLKERNVDLHIHVRQTLDSDIRRFCRIVTNKAIGLVLGGGGAKGFAHIGAVKALRDKGIEMDFVGGTSAGALYGIGIAHYDYDFTKAYDSASIGVQKRIVAKKFVLPMISLLSNQEMINYVQSMYGDMHMEDMWINSFCISTNYTDSKKEVLNTGLIWKNIAASIAIPGVFPPVVIGHKLYIDGGVMDNLPIETMQEYPVAHIIAIALSEVKSRNLNIDYLPSHWSLLWDKITKQNKYHFPGLASLIINSSLLHSNQLQQLKKEQVSLYIELDLKDIPLIDDKKWKEAISKGQSQAKEQLEKVNPFWAVKHQKGIIL